MKTLSSLNCDQLSDTLNLCSSTSIPSALGLNAMTKEANVQIPDLWVND